MTRLARYRHELDRAGHRAQARRARLGGIIVHRGPAGAGQVVKVCNRVVVDVSLVD